jgi:hypothetical protein
MALCLGISVMIGLFAYQYIEKWDALQRYYLLTYVFSGSKWLSGESRTYRLLATIERGRGPHLTEDWEVVALPAPGAHDPNFIPFTLSQDGIAAGDVGLKWIWSDAENEKLHNFLRDRVYHEDWISGSLRQACLLGLAVFVFGLCFAVPKDLEASEMRRSGRVARGPLVVTRDVFNRKRLKKRRTDGIALNTEEPPTLHERIFLPRSQSTLLRIPLEDEAKHIFVEGGTGSGKTLTMMYMLAEVLDRGHIAIVHDPSGEYVERFYSPERGDIILTQTDERAPSWNPSDEVEQETEALAIAHAFFPDQPRETPFFLTSVRKLFAHALRRHFTRDQLLELLCDSDRIDELVAGTPYASLIKQTAAAQREGVMGTMSHVADVLRLLKAEKDTTRKWTVREWVKNPKGSLFITSTGETREALRPLHSAMLDLLFLWMHNRELQSNRVPVWFLLDELASLHKLPQLEDALTMNRKSNNPIVLGLHGKAQLETIFGHISETMIAMPWTALFFKTNEPNAAEWISRYLGQQEIERLRESRTEGSSGSNRRSKTYVEESIYRYPIIASQISGLSERQGFLKSGNFIVPFTLCKREFAKRHKGHIPRDIGQMFPVLPRERRSDSEQERSRQREEKRARDKGQRFLD